MCTSSALSGFLLSSTAAIVSANKMASSTCCCSNKRVTYKRNTSVNTLGIPYIGKLSCQVIFANW